jgi:hypothetical protein
MLTAASAKQSRTLTASVRNVMPLHWSEKLFWKEFKLVIEGKEYTNTLDVVAFLASKDIIKHYRLKNAITAAPHTVSLRACIRWMFKHRIKFNKIWQAETNP